MSLRVRTRRLLCDRVAAAYAAGRTVRLKWRHPGHKRLVHPTAGAMTLSRQVLSLPDAAGQVVIAYYAEPGTASAAALASLG
ncbi:MAG TPA: hypothetical protein VGC83_11595 [Solirubrobacteraceae bacterium]